MIFMPTSPFPFFRAVSWTPNLNGVHLLMWFQGRVEETRWPKFNWIWT